MLRMDIARIVASSIRKGKELGHYDLEAFVVMPNHVHMLIWPKISPSRLMMSLKGATARAANKILGLTGEAFWQKESYDHWVRNDEELRKIRDYIDNNAVRAEMVADAREYPWASAGVEMSLRTLMQRGTHECVRYSITLGVTTKMIASSVFVTLALPTTVFCPSRASRSVEILAFSV